MLGQIIVLALFCQPAVSLNLHRSGYGPDFNLFVFTQWWPQTQCQIDADADWRFTQPSLNKTCVPQGITEWTIHGLWPTVGKEHAPVFCNSSWPFDESLVEDLRPLLEQQWPSFDRDYDNPAFWKHEWEKHGTCSTNLDYLNSEHKYFAVTLLLNIKYDLFRALAKSGITPSSEKTYKVKDIESALYEYFGVYPVVECLIKGPVQMLDSVELCLDKQLKLINCLESAPECNYDEGVQYPPIVPVYDVA